MFLDRGKHYQAIGECTGLPYYDFFQRGELVDLEHRT